MLREFSRVLRYTELRDRYVSLTEERVEEFLARLRFRGLLMRRVPHVFDYPRDREDERYIDLAAAAQAHCLITRDDDLLSLMAGHSLLCKQFRRKFKFLNIVTPEDFLREIGRPKI